MRNSILIGLALCCASAVMAQELPGDPTRPALYKPTVKTVKVAKRHYELSYLMIGESRKVAVVNGKRVTVGSWVDGARVVAITAQGVRLQVGNQSRTLSIGKQTGFKKEFSDRKRN